MKLHLAICISAAFNFILVGGIVFAIRNYSRTEPASAPLTIPTSAGSITTNAAVPPPDTITTIASFQWKQLLSDDLKVYRDNLLSIGCPRLTVRDIIQAEINGLFQQRRKLLLAQFQKQFWDYARNGEAAIRNEWGDSLNELNSARHQMIDDVLGLAFPVRAAQSETSQESLAWLPVEKRDRLAELEAQYHRNLANVEAQSMEQLRQEFEEARRALLTPEEFEEMQMRNSRESLWAAGLSGFQPTEDEWRKVSQLRADFEKAQQQPSNLDASHEELLKRQEQLQTQLNASLKEALGAERFAQYQLAGEHEFQQVHKITERYGLSETIAVRAYEIQQAAITKAQQVREAADLSDDQRENALKQIRLETERTLNSALGQKVFSTYKEYNGDWLKNVAAQGS